MRVGGPAALLLMCSCASVSGLSDFELGDGTGGSSAGGNGTAGDPATGGTGGGTVGGGGTGGTAPCLDPGDIHLGSSCYRIITIDATYLDAELDCQAITNGAHLAALSTIAELDDLVNALDASAPASMWLGADDDASEGTFTWLNGETFDYVPMMPPWAATEPNDDNGNEDCVELVTINPHINDNTCTNLLAHLCEYAAM